MIWELFFWSLFAALFGSLTGSYLTRRWMRQRHRAEMRLKAKMGYDIMARYLEPGEWFSIVMNQEDGRNSVKIGDPVRCDRIDDNWVWVIHNRTVSRNGTVEPAWPMTPGTVVRLERLLNQIPVKGDRCN